MADEKIRIIVEGVDKASRPLRNVNRALGDTGNIIKGILGAKLLLEIGRGIKSIGAAAFESVGNLQLLELQLEGMRIQSLMYEKINQTVTTTLRLSEKERLALQTLRARFDSLNVRLDKARYHYGKYLDAQGAAGIDTRYYAAQVATLEAQLAKTTSEMSKLEAKEGKVVTVTQQAWENTRDFAEAQGLAKEETKELLGWLNDLIAVVPFEKKSIAGIMRYAMATGLSKEMTKDMTVALMDWAAALGLDTGQMQFVGEQFIQLLRLGKLYEIDLRQLRRTGLDVAKILEIKLGMSVEEFNEKLKTSPELMEDLMQAFIDYSGEVTVGAVERMGKTWPGIIARFKNLMTRINEVFFEPMVDELGPAANKLLDKLFEFANSDQLREAGEKIGAAIGKAIDWVSSIDWEGVKGTIDGYIYAIGKAYERGGIGAVLLIPLKIALKDPDLAWADIPPMLQEQWEKIDWADLRTTVSDWWRDFWLGTWTLVESPEGEQYWIQLGGMKQGIIDSFDKMAPEIQNKIQSFWNDIWLGKETILEGAAGGLPIRMGGLKDTIVGFGKKIPGWVLDGVQTSVTGFEDWSTRLLAWSESDEVINAVKATGEKLGSAIAEGIKTFFAKEETGTSLATSLSFSLGKGLANIKQTLITIGSAFVMGFLEGMGAGPFTAEDVRKVAERAGGMPGIFQPVSLGGKLTGTGSLSEFLEYIGPVIESFRTTNERFVETSVAAGDLLKTSSEDLQTKWGDLGADIDTFMDVPLANLGDAMDDTKGKFDELSLGLDNSRSAWQRFVDIIKGFLLEMGEGNGQQSGTSWHPGGMTWVGERGPELVGLPRGSTVYNARQSRSMGGGGDSYNITINAAEAAPWQVERAVRRGILSARRARGLA